MYVLTTTAALLLSAANVLAQTPDDFDPSTSDRLSVTYGNTPVTPGIELPQALVQTAPTFNTQQPAPGPYMLALLDLSLPASRLPPGPFAPGIGSDRTTRLHYLQTNLTVSSSGALTPSADTLAVAPYAGPQPPQGDIPHIYSFFLLSQPTSFVVPEALLSGAFTSQGASARNNFSLTPITSQEGVELLEGNYIVVQNANNSGAVTTAPGYTPNGTIAGNGTGSASPTGTSTRAPVATFTGAAAKIGAAVPALGLGAMVMMFL